MIDLLKVFLIFYEPDIDLDDILLVFFVLHDIVFRLKIEVPFGVGNVQADCRFYQLDFGHAAVDFDLFIRFFRDCGNCVTWNRTEFRMFHTLNSNRLYSYHLQSRSYFCIIYSDIDMLVYKTN